jgi:uncharacterized membrane protein YgcG
MRRSRGSSFLALVRAFLAAFIAVALFLPALVVPVAAADPPPEQVDGQQIYDDGLLGETLLPTAQQLVDLMAQLHDIQVIVVARHRDAPVQDPDADAAVAAQAIADDWGLTDAVVLVVEADADDCNGGIGIATAGTLPAELDAGQLVDDNVRSALTSCVPGAAGIEALGGIVTGLSGIGTPGAGGGEPSPNEVPPGPPFPDPETDRAVYDQAGVFSQETIAKAESTIDAIEARTGAEVVVYSQVRGYGVTQEQADSDAQALMDQWGVGRKGFDDGLVILFDLDPSKKHGQVNLYGGPGYRAAYLDNTEKQRIFDEDMLPFLREGDLDGALNVALQKVDENATPEHAQKLQTARQIDAAVGLVGAPVVFLVLIGSAVFAWLRYGRDPVYLDDPSIHMAGPPRDLTPAAGTFVLNGGPSRRALTTALLDLASRGEIAFRQESEMFGLKKKVGVEVGPPAADANEEARRARNGVRPMGNAEDLANRHLAALAGGTGYIKPDDLAAGFASSVPKFDEALEGEVIAGGWFREKPSAARRRWMIRGTIALFLGIGGVVAGLNIPSNGLLLIGGAAIAAGIALIVLSNWMPAVSIPGSMIRAMLAAYRRTLDKTMAMSRSMDEVVEKAQLAWLQTPDQAVVWGTALGLEKEIEGVLERSLDDVTQGRAVASSTYFPIWYGSGAGGDADGLAAGGGGGLFSSSSIPDIGGMMASLSTIGNAPGGSGGGGGGFGGGGSGGGGGGSGGGF